MGEPPPRDNASVAGHRFDALTKALATTTSRRQALRLLGATLAGGVLAVLRPGHSSADDDECVQFCFAVFGEDLRAVECIVAAAHRRGLCYSCGPKSDGGAKPICCERNIFGKCSGVLPATCCAPDQECLNGCCVSQTTTTSTTPRQTTTTSTTAKQTTTTSTTSTSTTPQQTTTSSTTHHPTTTARPTTTSTTTSTTSTTTSMTTTLAPGNGKAPSTTTTRRPR